MPHTVHAPVGAAPTPTRFRFVVDAVRDFCATLDEAMGKVETQMDAVQAHGEALAAEQQRDIDTLRERLDATHSQLDKFHSRIGMLRTGAMAARPTARE